MADLPSRIEELWGRASELVPGDSGALAVVTEAIDWAVAHGADVISMSLGSDFGSEDSSDAEASEHAQEAGVIVTDPWGAPLRAPLDTHTPVAWVGYANATLQQRIAPTLQRLLREGATGADAGSVASRTP